MPSPHYRQALMSIFGVGSDEFGFWGHPPPNKFLGSNDDTRNHVREKGSIAESFNDDTRNHVREKGSIVVLDKPQMEHLRSRSNSRLKWYLAIAVSTTFVLSIVGSFVTFIFTGSILILTVPVIAAIPVLSVIRYLFIVNGRVP